MATTADFPIYYRAGKLSTEFFIARNSHPIVPISSLVIPDIVIPQDLSGKKSRPELKDTLSTFVRQLLNSVTTNNVDNLRQQLLQEINIKVVSEDSLVEIADELLKCFIVSVGNINNYMKILNTIYKIGIVVSINPDTGEKVLSRSIRNIFLEKCRLLIIKNIAEDNIMELANKDQEDDDELDYFNREREKIINLIILLCRLYDQRNTQLINLTAVQLYAVMDKILCFHQKCYGMMIKLGDPMQECIDEEQYEYLRRMCCIYAELMYTFFQNNYTKFLEDQTEVRGNKLINIIERFQKEIVPHLSEAHMRNKCIALFNK